MILLTVYMVCDLLPIYVKCKQVKFFTDSIRLRKFLIIQRNIFLAYKLQIKMVYLKC